MIEEKVTVYRAEDGTIFEEKKDCEKYEADIKAREKKTSYWSVSCKPDLTEGRGLNSLMLLEVYGPEYDADLWVKDYCYRNLGRPIAFVQGVSATPNWTVSKITREIFLKKCETKCGDFKYNHSIHKLVKGKREEGLVEN